MHSRSPFPSRRALATILCLAASSPLVRGQAGLSGKALDGQTAEQWGRNSLFDNGRLNSQSALQQLEQLSGGRVDQSSSQTVPSSRNATLHPTAPHLSSSQMLQVQLAGALAETLADALFSDLFTDNSAQQRAQAQAAAAARAAAEAEALRVQQELARQARIRQAQHYRADWDARDREIADQLADAFSIQAPAGTAFFGQPANPDADEVAALIGADAGAAATADSSDSAGVDLRGSSLVVPPLRGGVTGIRMPAAPSGSILPRWSYDAPDGDAPTVDQTTPSQLAGLMAYFGPWLGDYYTGLFKSTLKSASGGRSPSVPGLPYVKAILGAKKQVEANTKELSGIYDPALQAGLGGASDAAYVLGNPYLAGEGYADRQFEAVDQAGGQVVVGTWKMIFEQFQGRLGGIDLRKLGSVPEDQATGYLNDVPEHADAFRIRQVLFGTE